METENTAPHLEEFQCLVKDKKFLRTLELFLYYQKQMSPEDISEFTGRHISTVYRTINNWAEYGHIEEKAGRGRLLEYSQKEADKVIEMQLQNRRKTSMTIYREMGRNGSPLSYMQTRSIINQNFTKIEGKRKIVISSKNKEKRLEWVTKYEKARKQKWRNVCRFIRSHINYLGNLD